MNAVIDSLLDVVRQDPLPARHTSSHWRQYGSQTIVERRGAELILEGAGFGSMWARHPALRILNAIQQVSYGPVTRSLRHYPEIWRAVKRLARQLSFDLTFDVWKCGAALAVLMDHWSAQGLAPQRFAMIGDGYGFLGALIRRVLPGSRIYCIDLPKMLVFQAHTHERADRAARLSHLSGPETLEAEVTFVAPDDIDWIPGPIDCAVNIASMQEMTPRSIRAYFTFLRRRASAASRFYCVNRQRKALPGGEVTSFADYPWQDDDERFLDGPCPYYTHLFSATTLSSGPRIFGRRVPFVNYFDGAHLHRLVRLAPEATNG